MGRPVIRFEIGCRDAPGPIGKPNRTAIMIKTGAEGGIGGHITSLGHEPQNYVTFYVQVDDLDAYLVKAADLGGKKLAGPIHLPNGSFAWMADPDGNIIGLWKGEPPSTA
jgi:predicted enzyme related to lactoylglutathione lyase